MTETDNEDGTRQSIETIAAEQDALRRRYGADGCDVDTAGDLVDVRLERGGFESYSAALAWARQTAEELHRRPDTADAYAGAQSAVAEEHRGEYDADEHRAWANARLEP